MRAAIATGLDMEVLWGRRRRLVDVSPATAVDDVVDRGSANAECRRERRGAFSRCMPLPDLPHRDFGESGAVMGLASCPDAQELIPGGAGFEMRRVATARVLAPVPHPLAQGYRSVGALVDQAMGHQQTPADGDAAVSPVVDLAPPGPARVRPPERSIRASSLASNGG